MTPSYLKGYCDWIQPECVLDVCGKRRQKGAQMEERQRNDQINKQINYSMLTLCWMHFATNVCNISRVMSVRYVLSNCAWPLMVWISARWVDSECSAHMRNLDSTKWWQRNKAALNTITQITLNTFHRLNNSEHLAAEASKEKQLGVIFVLLLGYHKVSWQVSVSCRCATRGVSRF